MAGADETYLGETPGLRKHQRKQSMNEAMTQARIVLDRIRLFARRANVYVRVEAYLLSISLRRFLRTRLRIGVAVALALALIIASIVGVTQLIATLTAPTPNPASAALIDSLPGGAVWNDQASSLLFGTNDTYEWSSHNLENEPGVQTMLRAANFTLVRTFIPDKASDATI